MSIGVKHPIADSEHAKQPDFSIPGAAAKHHDAAAQYYEEAARQHREASKYYQSGDHEKAGHHAHLAYAHHLHAEQHAAEAAKAQIKNHGGSLYEVAQKTHNKSGRIETFS